jgi:hypothetical protein
MHPLNYASNELSSEKDSVFNSTNDIVQDNVTTIAKDSRFVPPLHRENIHIQDQGGTEETKDIHIQEQGGMEEKLLNCACQNDREEIIKYVVYEELMNNKQQKQREEDNGLDDLEDVENGMA